METSQDIHKLEVMIQGIEVGMLTTEDNNGCLRSRPMATAAVNICRENSLWFFVRSDTSMAKVNGEWINVSYADPAHHKYVSVSGIAHLVNDRQKVDELWEPSNRAWFPNGKDDPNLALLQVRVQQAEYWDRPGNRVIQFFGIAKALAMGRAYAPSEHEHVNL